MTDADEAPYVVTTPWRRDAGELQPLLEAWARSAVSDSATVFDVQAPEGTGMSSETVLFDMRRGEGGGVERFAARLAPLPSVYPVFPEYDIEMQRRCMNLVRERTAVPTPEVPWCELDPAWLGVPFLVMHRVDGAAPPDMPPYVFGGWVMDASPDERARMQENAVRVLAGVHEVTAENAGLSFLARPEYGDTALAQQIGYQRWYYEWARNDVRYPLIDRTFAWLEDRPPEEGPTVLNWGDARIGNILWEGMEPVAVLDWEMASAGPVEVDLAWMIFLHTFFQDIAERYEMPGIPGFMDRREVVEAYERISGRTVRDLEWYEVFAALRFAIVSVRTSTRGIAYGAAEKTDDPDDLIMFRSLLEKMLDGTFWSG
ncbi:MAG: phosphotransferase family protein [Acidimicrobiia bacterium]|nr:phosphotransferase family protein [Acidimicrobiia bacterium]